MTIVHRTDTEESHHHWAQGHRRRRGEEANGVKQLREKRTEAERARRRDNILSKERREGIKEEERPAQQNVYERSERRKEKSHLISCE